MATPKFKQRCARCKKNMVLMYSSRQFPLCNECHLKQVNLKIDDPKWAKFFDIPQELYEKYYFLRSIKECYLRFNAVTEKQAEAFKKIVKEEKAAKKKKDKKVAEKK